MAAQSPGPIEQLRLATRSPVALTMGALMGAIVPLSTYAFAHHSGLLTAHDGHIVYAEWSNPDWLILLGGLGFSARTVYHWAHQSFEEGAKAVGFTLLLEGVLMRAPIPELSYVALAYLVVLNALGTGAVLALRDQRDRARSADREPTDYPTEVQTVAFVAPSEAPALPTETRPTEADGASLVDVDLYGRAIALVRSTGKASMSSLREGLGVGTDRATRLLSRLESDGFVSAPTANGRRTVLQSVEAAE